jgi:predicted TIM-barrel fold metal-dependent hydrolase
MPNLQEPLTGLKSYKDQQTYKDSTFKYLKQFHVVKAVTDGQYATDYFHTEPDIIIPAVHYGDLDSLEVWFKNGTFKVLAEFRPQLYGMAPNDEKLEKYFALAEQYNIPMGIHMGLGAPGAAYRGFPEYRMGLGKPLLLEDVLIKHPKLRIYVMHAGWPFIDEMLGLLYAHPQVYVDVAVINWVLPVKEFHTYLKRIVDAGYSNRIMYGSDEMQWPQSYAISVANIQSADFITSQQKEDIFYNNAARFLKLSEQDIKKHKGQ